MSSGSTISTHSFSMQSIALRSPNCRKTFLLSTSSYPFGRSPSSATTGSMLLGAPPTRWRRSSAKSQIAAKTASARSGSFCNCSWRSLPKTLVYFRSNSLANCCANVRNRAQARTILSAGYFARWRPREKRLVVDSSTFSISMEDYFPSSIQLNSSAPKHIAFANRRRKIGRTCVRKSSARCSKIAWTPAVTRRAKRCDATNATHSARISRASSISAKSSARQSSSHGRAH